MGADSLIGLKWSVAIVGHERNIDLFFRENLAHYNCSGYFQLAFRVKGG